jgi:hypothetical protein
MQTGDKSSLNEKKCTVQPPPDTWDHPICNFGVVYIDNVAHCVIRLIKHDVSDENWAVAKRYMRHFLKWVKHTETRYNFIFDLHESDAIPMSRMYDLQVYLGKKQNIISTYLISSVVITQSVLLQKIVQAALEIYPTTRPLTVFVQAHDRDAERAPSTHIPLDMHKKIMRHLKQIQPVE